MGSGLAEPRHSRQLHAQETSISREVSDADLEQEIIAPGHHVAFRHFLEILDGLLEIFEYFWGLAIDPRFDEGNQSQVESLGGEKGGVALNETVALEAL